jgi:hypothetical protein
MAHIFPNYIESSTRSNQTYRENYGTTQTSCSIIFTLRKRYKKTCVKELDLTRSDRADNHAIEDNRTWQRAKTAARTKEKQKKRRKNSGETGQRGSEEEVKRKRTGEEQQRRAAAMIAIVGANVLVCYVFSVFLRLVTFLVWTLTLTSSRMYRWMTEVIHSLLTLYPWTINRKHPRRVISSTKT